MFKSQADYFQLNKKYEHLGFETKLIHCGSEPSQEFGGVSCPIDFSSTFAQPSPGKPVVFDYARCGNPTRLALERLMASLEHANFALATNCGMSANTTVLKLCKHGDHVICVDDIYGETKEYLGKIIGPNLGLELSYDDFSNIERFEKLFRPNTRQVWLESPTNPFLRVFDIEKLAKICKKHGALLVVDNTFMSPLNQNPLDLGADIVAQSLTKYISGHSDIVAGCICLNDRDIFDRL